MAKIKLVIFDLDDCLIDRWNATFPFAIKSAIKAMTGAGLKISSFENAVKRLDEINIKSKNVPEAITKYLEEINSFKPEYVEIGKNAVYNFSFEGRIKPLPNAVKTLNYLAKSGIKLVLVSKGEKEIQLKNMETAGINKELFKKIFIVPDYNKAEPYKKILKELNCPAENVLVVGDRYETDLLPGKSLGAKTAWVSWGRGKINPPKETDIDYVINDLAEIVKIVKDS